MLQQASVIGECDQVGQELGPASTTIHDVCSCQYRPTGSSTNTCAQRLVQVYTQLLEFYIAAMRFFSHGSMVLRIMSEAVNDRLSSIVTDFLSYADLLHQSIDNAVAKLTADISRLLLDNKSMIYSHILLPSQAPVLLITEMITSCAQSRISSGSRKKRGEAGITAVFKR